jgi:phage head maturation protease
MREMVRRAASLGSFDEATNTVQLVWTTGAVVRRRDRDGEFDEELVVDSKAIRLHRLNQGAPLLDSHASYELRKIIGSVVPGSAKIEAGRGVATVLLSKRAEAVGVVQDIRDGIIRHISVGYKIHGVDKQERSGSVPLHRITDWEPMEISAVPIPADPGAQFREEPEMPQVSQSGVEAERARAAEIIALGRQFDLPSEQVDGAIREGTSVADLKAAVLESQARRSAATTTFGTAELSHGTRFEGRARNAQIAEALFSRLAPDHPLEGDARQFRGMNLRDAARDALERAGESTRGLADAELVTRALHGTTDFPAILGDLTGRHLRRAYNSAPSGIRRLARKTTAPDFRAKHSLQLSEGPKLEKVNEHGEFKRGTISESKESYAIATYGKVIGITRQALINDDLSAFERLPSTLTGSAASLEAQTLVDLLVGSGGVGPAMNDGNPFFHAASHKNVGTPAAALDENTLSAARLAMRRQTGLKGDLIAVTPKFILVPPEQETKAEKVVAAFTAAKTADANAFAGKLEVVVEPRLTNGTRWYVAGDPTEIDGIEFAYLEGNEGPQIETRHGFDVDGLEIKVRLDFGAGALDWRGWFTNAGA